ncbi:protein kinase [Nonomuraea sp. MTCD27]|uniref:protein kinase domain-containing protein n=1 Tax=Nonomuraea sp. MTCD27 TaxID=1676747 RepID=UPI0035BF3344
MAQAPFAQGDARQFGDYWLGRQLGSGGQGVVYEAYDPAGTRVAIKLLRFDRAESEQARVRFVKEVAATRRVAPFCTARVIDAELDGAQPYIVGEYVDGPSLRRAVDERGPYEGAELHRLATGVATALTAIHLAGVVHRDLKPDNVMLGPDGPRVIDFGIARVEGATLTDDGPYPLGTPGYMSPERVRGEPATQAADVWAWGAVVLFAATGRPPFLADTAAAMYNLVLVRRPDLGALRGTLRRLVSDAMSYDPGDRPDAKFLLENLLDGKGETRLLLAEGSRVAETVRRPYELTTEAAGRPLGDVAEEIFASLGPDDQAVVPGVLLRMVLPGDGADGVLRRAHVDDLMDGTLDTVRVGRVLGGFSGARLLQHEGETVTLASPALLRAWPRLRAWIDADRQGLLLHSLLGEAARLWEAGGRSDDDLYRGTALRAALRGLADGTGLLAVTSLERTFLEASRAHERRRNLRRRQVRAAVAGLVAVTLAAAGIAVVGGTSGAEQRNLIAARKAAETADRLRASDPARAALLSLAAWHLAPREPVTRSALYGALAQRETHTPRPAAADGGGRFDLSPDGSALAVVRDGTVSLWDVATGRPVPTALSGVAGNVTATALGRTLLAVAAPDGVRLWDRATGRPASDGFGLRSAERLHFNATGTMLTVIKRPEGGQVWDLSDLRRPVLTNTDPGLEAIEVSGDGRLMALVSTQAPYRLLDRRGRRLAMRGSAPAGGGAAAFAPDGRTLAVTVGSAVKLWDVPDGRWTRTLRGAAGRALAFSADGGLLVSYDGETVSVFRRSGARLLAQPVRNLSGVPRFDAAGSTLGYLLTGGEVARLDLKPLTGGAVLRRPAQAGAIDDRAQSAVLHGGATTMLARIGGPARSLRAARGPDVRMAFSPGGGTLAVTVPGTGRVVLWDVATRRRLRTLTVRTAGQVGGLAFSADGGTLALAPYDDVWEKVQLWDARRGVLVRQLDQPGSWQLAFSPDGRLLAVNGPDRNGVVKLAGRPEYRPGIFGEQGDSGRAVAFSRDGKVMAAGGATSGIDLWDAAGLRRLRHLSLPEQESDQLPAAAFSPDGSVLAAGGMSGRIWLWSVADGRRLGPPLPQHGGGVLGLAFTPDGGTLHSVGADGALRTLPVDPRRAADAVCARVPAPPTEREWSALVPDADYRKVC